MIYFDIILNKKLNLFQILKLSKKLKATFLRKIFSKEVYLGNNNIEVFYVNRRLSIKCNENQVDLIFEELANMKKLDSALIKTRGKKEFFQNVSQIYKMKFI